MTGRTIILCTVLGIIIVSCCIAPVWAAGGTPPSAGIALSAQSGPAPLTVVVTDVSSGSPTGWQWFIDDNLYDVKQGPFTLTFKNPGTVRIGLLVKNAYGTAFTEKTITVLAASPGCTLAAGADRPVYLWGEKIALTGNAIGCTNGIKVKLGEAPQGPELKVTVAPQNSGIPEGFDLATGMAGTDSSFAFTLDTSILKQQYGLADGDYSIYVVSLDAENQYARVPVHLGILGSPTCSMSINNAGKYENTWGDKLTFTGIAENCPNGVQFHLTKDVTMPLPGIEIGSTKQVSGSAYTWTWDSGQTWQKYSLPDGIYSVRVTDSSGAPMASKVDVKMTSSGLIIASCNHYVYLLSTNGTGMPEGLGGVDISVSGSADISSYDPQNVVSTGKTSSDGLAVITIGSPALGTWNYFHIRPGDPPAGHQFPWAVTSPPGYFRTYSRQEICGKSTQIWYEPVPGVPPTTRTPAPFLKGEPPAGSGTGTPGALFLNNIFSLPSVIMSYVGLAPALRPENGKPVNDLQSQDSVSIAGIYPPPDVNGQAVAGNDPSGGVHVVVLPGSAGSVGDPGSKIVSEPEIVILDSGTGMNQVHMIDTPTPVPLPTLPPVVVMSVPTTGIASQPEIASPASLPCPAGYHRCFGMCTDLMSDPSHCGSCNGTCASGTTCASGVCSLQCSAGQVSCGGTCADLNNDPYNCGSCGHGCISGVPCTNGKCVAQVVTTQATRLGGVRTRGF